MKAFNNKDVLQENLRLFVDGTIYDRGLDYYNSGQVESMKVVDVKYCPMVKIDGEVLGTSKYSAYVIFDAMENKFVDMDCSCPYNFSCKHSVAVALNFIDKYTEFLDAGGYGDSEINIETLTTMKDYINGASVKIKGEETKETLEGLLDSIGIDVESVPPHIVDMLRKKMKTTEEKEKPVEKPKKPVAEKYHIILNFYEKYPYISLMDTEHGYDDYGYRYSNASSLARHVLEKEKGGLTKPQEDLFVFIRDMGFDESEIDYGKFFVLLKSSGVKAYRGNKRKNNELFFLDTPKKINVELALMEKIHPDVLFSDADFIFKLGDEYKNTQKYNVISGGGNVVVIEGGNAVSLYEMPQYLAEMIARAVNGEYRYYDFLFGTVLREEEVIKLNDVIKDCQKYFNLKSEIEPDYNIVEYDNAEPVILADYDMQNASLEIKPAIDYGFKKLNVADSIFYSHSKLQGGVKRREYPEFGKKYLIEVQNKDIFYATINKDMEKNLFLKFYNNAIAYGFSKTLKCKRKGEEQVISFFDNNWKLIKKLEYKIEFPHDEFDFRKGEFTADFNVDFNTENDLLAFDVACYCGKDKIGIEDLKNYIKKDRRFIKTKEGKMLRITNREEFERFLLMLESFHENENGKFEGRVYSAPELEDIFTSSKYYNAKTTASFKKFMKEAKRGRSVKKTKLPAVFSNVLRDYQKEGIDWLHFLRKYRFAGILADDMGIGKTLQALVLMEVNKIKGRPSIVVAPKTLLHNWQDEVVKFMPKTKVVVVDGLPSERMEAIKNVKKCDIVVTSYSVLQKDLLNYEKQKIKFNYCVLDEAQFIKNYKTKTAQTVKKINADYRIALTGTPLENSVAEIWSIFEFLMPGFLGNHKFFTEKFQNPIMKNNDTVALQALRKKLECFMLRRTKEEVLKELPPKIEQVSRCELTDAQSILYQEILASVKNDISKTVEEKGFAKSQIHILAGLMKLRQVCNHPALLLKKQDYTKYESAKLELFLDLVREISSAGRKVLVFSQFTKMLDILAKELDKNNIKYAYLSGKTRDRRAVVKSFNENEENKVFLISLKAGGTGLNLTSADNVIVFDPWWNPSVERQAIDRAHRIGQKNSVNVYRLITKGTIEEKIVKLQEKKKFLFDNLIGESKDLFKKLTWDDIKGLFE